MNIKQKVEKILDEYGDASSCGLSGFSTEPYVDKIDLLYRKEIEKEIREVVNLCSDCKAQGIPEMLEVHLQSIFHKKETNKI